MLLDDLMNEELTRLQMQAETDESVIRSLGSLLIKNDFVDDEYVESVWEREQEYPTGIENNGYNFAIAHASGGTIYRPAVAMGVLEEPAEFRKIDNPNKTTPVKIVIMLALTEPEEHLEALKTLIQKLQSTDLFQRICSCTTTERAVKLICGSTV